ncbi:D-alanyl-D-alanine carboxypeptidase family protein [Serpentinicella sp. ANB-PHB4]|uniref:D-alanyl-D-alanine carboxypeptidase family protein n=1 Tax=Serpentinicella sp. ANB-PHB4 TaxID=3074076 RepID=UPI0028566C74|nr:D-alanyl-D-alanine carboxypeptidase family protein [Serpentinicella sp. ANB-PHB4]MDR5658051.1 D-alanyl-D-alanine carboxypeptidase family protein [Serpentinicella sp. ANB-PHB4]
MKIKLTTFITTLLFIIITASSVSASPQITAPNAILMDYQTGEILYEKNAHTPAYPASTTKVLTALIVLENLDLNEYITVDEDLFVIGSSMYLKKGETFTVDELLQALLIRSANDVAEVFATHISGSVEAFADLMNQRAEELGASDSHFTNPHGLPDDNHVSTAYDLALISRSAMENERFREIVNTTRLTFDPTEQTPETRYFRNTNRFLWGTGGAHQILYNGQYIDIKYDKVDGIKTGYTGQAGNCLVSSAVNEDQRLISVVLGTVGTNVYLDSRTLLDYGFDNYKLLNLINKSSVEQIDNLMIKNGTSNSLTAFPESDLWAAVSINTHEVPYEKQIVLNEDLIAPIEEGQLIGEIRFLKNNQIISTNLLAMEAIPLKPFFQRLVDNNVFRVIIGVFLLWQCFIFILRSKRKRQRKYLSSHFKRSYKINRNLLK